MREHRAVFTDKFIADVTSTALPDTTFHPHLKGSKNVLDWEAEVN